MIVITSLENPVTRKQRHDEAIRTCCGPLGWVCTTKMGEWRHYDTEIITLRRKHWWETERVVAEVRGILYKAEEPTKLISQLRVISKDHYRGADIKLFAQLLEETLKEPVEVLL